MIRRTSAVLASAALCLAAFAAPAVADETSADAAKAETVKVKLAVDAKRFRIDGGEVYARGPMQMRTVGADGEVRTLKRRVSMPVAAVAKKNNRNCKILELNLEELYLDLLGLEVSSSEINVRIRGTRKRTLGKLFCKLAEGVNLSKIKLARRTAHSLNERLANRRDLKVVGLRAKLHSQTLAEGDSGDALDEEGKCEVLDLDLGPLNLDLLGLIVELYGNDPFSPVRINAVADPEGGILGETLCELTGGPSGGDSDSGGTSDGGSTSG